MAKNHDPKTHRRCTECGKVKSLSEFMKSRHPATKIVICDPCARANMARYEMSRHMFAPRVGHNPADAFRLDED